MLNTFICNISFLYALAPAWCDSELPKLEAGLWKVTTTVYTTADTTYIKTRESPYVSHLCTGQNSQHDMLKLNMGLTNKTCSKKELRIDGGKVFSNSICKMGDSTVTNEGKTIFLDKSNYQSEVLLSYNPVYDGEKKRRITNVAQFVGTCKADQKPGDFIAPNGNITSIRSLL